MKQHVVSPQLTRHGISLTDLRRRARAQRPSHAAALHGLHMHVHPPLPMTSSFVDARLAELGDHRGLATARATRAGGAPPLGTAWRLAPRARARASGTASGGSTLVGHGAWLGLESGLGIGLGLWLGDARWMAKGGDT